MVLSLDPVASTRPSLLRARQVTAAVCPSKRCRSCVSLASLILATVSALQVMTLRLSGVNTTW
jgi:hypothetical protein